jgi:hypothetical protein
MGKTLSRGRGRPPKADDERADERLEVRVTAAEKAEWEAAADRVEVKFAAWIRDRLNEAAKRESNRGLATYDMRVKKGPAH